MEKVTQQQLQDWLEPLSALIRQAGQLIVEVYESSEPLQVDQKSDASPVTLADKLSHDCLVKGLKGLTPDIPVLSEEQQMPDFEERRQWQRYWLVDPLDGTREFIKRSHQFTINVALIEQGEPVLGLIAIPIEKRLYAGIPSADVAWCDIAKAEGLERQRLQVSEIENNQYLRVMTSGPHRSKALQHCVDLLSKTFDRVECLPSGSAIKFCRLAEGKGDIYPRFSPCCEWDTAAGQAILEAAGGELVGTDFKPLRYNQQPSIISPHFYALGGRGCNWRKMGFTSQIYSK